MKKIWIVIIFAAIAGNIIFAGDVDFTGEWFVESDNDGDPGITAVINEPPQMPYGATFTKMEPDGSISVYIAGRGGVTLQSAQYDFAVIPAGTFFDFEANGSKLNGSIIRGETEDPILNGKISGDKITFTIKETIKENTYSYLYTGRLSNDSIQFDVRPPANGGKPFKFTVKKEAD